MLWYRVAVILRSIGWAAGVVFLLFLFALIAAIGLFIVGPLRGVHGTTAWIATISAVVAWTPMIWLYLFVGIGFLAPSTGFTMKIRILDRQAAAGSNGLSRSSAIFILGTSGALARAFFRAITSRRINVGIRPDLSKELGELASSILLAVPAGGADRLSKSIDSIVRYRLFVRDVAGLLIVERLDLISHLVRLYPDILVEHTTDDMDRYLRPLGRRTPIEAITEFVLPLAAIMLSVTAIAISMLKQ